MNVHNSSLQGYIYHTHTHTHGDTHREKKPIESIKLKFNWFELSTQLYSLSTSKYFWYSTKPTLDPTMSIECIVFVLIK